MSFTPIRRRFVFASLALSLATALQAQPSSAENYPRQPIKLVVPYAAGGGPDVLARRLADKLGPLLGQTVYVDNRVGAGGVIAAETVAAARPDGYTLLLGASTHVTQKLLSPSVRFDPLTQFVHITRIGTSPSVLIVAANSPYRSVRELADAARAAPDKLNYASGGIGSAAHLSGAAFVSAAGVEVAHIPYRGSVDIVPSIMTGDTQFGFPVLSTALPFVEQGKVRALAVTSSRRSARLPDVPTLKEALGRDELVLDAWSGLWAPAATPKPIVDKINAAVLKALADPQLRKAYDDLGAPVNPTATPQEFTQFVLAETAKYARLVARSGISTQ